MPAYEHTYLQTSETIRLHLVLAGPPDGVPVLLLHGFPEYWGGWQRQIMALAARGYRVIAPDQRGYNLSSAPKDVETYSLNHLSQDVIAILDHYKIDKIRLVGHDWGAAVAWTASMLHPERIEKLVILNVPHPSVMIRTLGKSPRQMLKSWYIGFFQIPRLADWLMSLNHFAGALSMLKASGKSSTFSPDDLEGYRKAYTNSGGLTGMINWYRAMLKHRPVTPRDIRIKMPVLILWGKQDIALSANMAEDSLKLCENGKLIFFENATHWVQHDEANAVNNHLLDFFKN